jgi:uncharacterized protein (TIGR03382 family)
MEYGSPAPFWAFALAMVSGTLLAIGSYVGGTITGGFAVLVAVLWQRARRRGDDARHTIW